MDETKRSSSFGINSDRRMQVEGVAGTIITQAGCVLNGQNMQSPNTAEGHLEKYPRPTKQRFET